MTPAVKVITRAAQLERKGGGLCGGGETYKRCIVDRFETAITQQRFPLQLSSLSPRFHFSVPHLGSVPTSWHFVTAELPF